MTNNDFMIKCTDCVNLRSIGTRVKPYKTWIQSICYIEAEDALVICYTLLDDTSNLIEKVRRSDMSLINTADNLSYGHINDITYNPNTNKLYLTPMYNSNSGFDRNLIYVLNATTFAKESEIHVGTNKSNSVYGIAYDQINDQYYVAMSNNMLAILNSSFEIITTFNFLQHGVNSYGNIFQCIEYYDGKLFFLYYEKIVVFDNQGNYLNSFAVGSDIESEGLASLGNGDFALGKIYDTNKETINNEVLTFNVLDCRNVVDLLSTEVGATVGEDTSEEIREKININVNAKILNNYNYINRKSNIVQCSICITNITSVGSLVVAIIPAGYRPKRYMRVKGACSGNNFARFEIAPNGNIMITATSLTSIQSSHWFELQVTYLVN